MIGQFGERNVVRMSAAVLLGERCVTSKKRLRGRPATRQFLIRLSPKSLQENLSVWKICWLKTFLPMSPNCNSGSTAGWFCRTRPRSLSVRFLTLHRGWRPFSFFISFFARIFHIDGDLTSYMLLILRTYRQFRGFCWLNHGMG